MGSTAARVTGRRRPAAVRRGGRLLFLAAAVILASLSVVAEGQGRLRTPVPKSPANGAVTELVPAFAWTAVPGAAAYEFQIAADAGMNSPVLGRGKDQFITKNLRASLLETVPNGTYYWRVRAITESGSTSPWSRPQSFRKRWSGSATLQTPSNSELVSYPLQPLKLSWTAVPGAAGYRVSIATDPALGSLVGGKAVETSATSYTRAGVLPSGVYYWGITPLDTRGNPAVPSPVSSFTWVWPSTTTTRVVDLAPETEIFDPQFAWDRVPGAARYEVEVNSSQDFATGSKVCCSSPTIATSLSPTRLFKDNVYYWRMRAIDASGNAGVWNVGPSFNKAFDKVPPVAAPSIKNLHMRDNLADPGSDVDGDASTGYQTTVPILTWDPVPGTSSYQVEVTPYVGPNGSGGCDWSADAGVSWQVLTAVTAWTPLGTSLSAGAPFGNPAVVARETSHLVGGERYCARVRAQSDRDNLNRQIFGDYTYLENTHGWTFQWEGYPVGDLCSPSCAAGGYLGAADYALPQRGTVTGAMPLFTWRPLLRYARAVLRNAAEQQALELRSVSPGYGGDGLNVTVTDSTTASGTNDRLVISVVGKTESFEYPQGDLDALAAMVNAGSDLVSAKVLAPGPLAFVSAVPFAPGKQSYFVIVAKDSAFTNIVDYAFTQIPAYAPRAASRPTTYSDETTTYYWAVLPATGLDGGGGTAGNPLIASPGDFQKRSTPPTLLAPADGTDVVDQPTFRWTVANAARRYRFQVAQDPTFANPIDDVTTNSTAYTSETTYPADTTLYWRVRADDENLVGLTWSATGTFRRRLPVPVLSPANPAAGDFIPTWTWEPTAGAVSYDVAVDLPDGTHRDLKALSTAGVTPTLMYGTGKFSWKVRANFPTPSTQVVPGPYSSTSIFTRTIGEPGGAHADVSKKHLLLSWEPKSGVKGYYVQISERADFARVVEQVKTDNTSYAPLLKQRAYQEAPALYWRVAAYDEGNNVGDYTQAQVISRPKRMVLSAKGAPDRGRSVVVTITVVDKAKRPLRLVRVRVTGAGVPAVTRRTDRRGKATFKVRAIRGGTVTYRATKTGFEPGVLTQRVR